MRLSSERRLQEANAVFYNGYASAFRNALRKQLVLIITAFFARIGGDGNVNYAVCNRQKAQAFANQIGKIFFKISVPVFKFMNERGRSVFINKRRNALVKQGRMSFALAAYFGAYSFSAAYGAEVSVVTFYSFQTSRA